MDYIQEEFRRQREALAGLLLGRGPVGGEGGGAEPPAKGVNVPAGLPAGARAGAVPERGPGGPRSPPLRFPGGGRRGGGGVSMGRGLGRLCGERTAGGDICTRRRRFPARLGWRRAEGGHWRPGGGAVSGRHCPGADGDGVCSGGERWRCRRSGGTVPGFSAGRPPVRRRLFPVLGETF